jgi:dynein heavy chain, axonemal
MTDNVRIVFEAEDLRNASPATVSRAGIIYVSGSVLGYEPIFECWLNSLTTPEISAVMNEHWQKFFHDVNTLDWLSKNTKNMMSCTQVHLVTNMLSLLSSLLPTSFEADKGQEVFLQRIFLYSLTWALGGLLEGDDRLKFHHFIALQPGLDLPPTVGEETLYDYRAGNDGEWERWKAPLWYGILIIL